MTLGYQSADGEEGFPGNLEVRVTYRLEKDNALCIHYQAVAEKETPINLTNHSYFNLTGDASRSVLSHQFKLDAPFFTPTDAYGIPTGEIRSVKGTPMDFTQGKEIGRDLFSDDPLLMECHGYDHNFVLGGMDGVRPVAWVYEPDSGRLLEVRTDQPGMQFYTSNYLDGSDVGKGGTLLQPYSGFCLETQCFPDSVNCLHFPSPFYAPGAEYSQKTVYRFSVKE